MHLGLQVTMDISQLVQLIDPHKHLGNVEPRDFLFEDTGIIEEGSEVASGNIFHREINVLRVLEGVQETD